MPLGAYPFAERFGWLVDRFGVSWQLSVGSRAQRVVPCLMFTGEQHGRAAEAMETWTALLGGSITHVDRYGPGEGEREGTVKHATFEVDGRTLTAIDSGYPHGFGFTGAISFLVPCDDQAEVDRLWDALGDGGAPGPCGWLTDRFGVTWQVVPRVLFDLLADPARADRVTRAMLSMQKLDAEALQRA
jgi:predicted 3-demethylubiquinone-9 3-methyltransferase (glyoxalase superfamily)